MGDYEADARVRVTAQQLFDYISDIENMPKYLPRMRSVEPTDADTVHVTGKLDGNDEVERDATFKVDDENHTLSWASDKHGYHGHLTVTGYGRNAGIAVTVSTQHGDPHKIQQSVNETVATIKTLLEDAHPRPVFDPAWSDHHEEPY
jgi:uncharacterized membrane protein